ncbi:MAG: Calx-beta domain-containing protein [Panacagrimonas sp.]
MRTMNLKLNRYVLALAATMLSPLPATLAAPDLLGGEFRANTSTLGGQAEAAVTRDADGDYVIAWSEYRAGYDILNVFAQRFDAAGHAQGTQFRVNTTTTNPQSLPSVAMDAQGNFVVGWAGYGGQDGNDFGVFGRRFQADGQPLGREFPITSQPVSGLSGLAMAMDPDGDFIVTWDSADGDGSSYGVFAQRFSANSARVGPPFRVNTYTGGSQREPAIAMSPDGAFVIVWSSDGQDGSSRGIYGQRFRRNGTPIRREFRVNVTTTHAQLEPSVAMDAAGDFVVAWHSYAAGARDPDVIARRFSASAEALGPEFRVDDSSRGAQSSAAVAMDTDGDFFIAWSDQTTVAAAVDVVGRRFHADGSADGLAFRINSTRVLNQRFPAIALDADGDAVVAWQSLGQDGSDYGVYGQRFRGPETVDLGLRLNATPGPGGTACYTATLSNQRAPEAQAGVESIDSAIGSAINPHVRFILSGGAALSDALLGSAPVTCRTAGFLSTCQLDQPLAAGASATLSFAVTGPGNALVSVSAVALSDSADETPADNSARRDIRIACAPARIEFDAEVTPVTESAGNAVVRVLRLGGSCGAASALVDARSGSARPGLDYTPAVATLSWADGESGEKLFSVAIRNDGVRELSEQFDVRLRQPVNASLGPRAQSRVVILDDDG